MFVVGRADGGSSESTAESLDTDKKQQYLERTCPRTQSFNSECQRSDLKVLIRQSLCRLDLASKTISKEGNKVAKINLQLYGAKPQIDNLPHSEYQKSDLKPLICDSICSFGGPNSITIIKDIVEANRMQLQMLEAKTQPEHETRALITRQILSIETRNVFAATCGKRSGLNLKQICSTIELQGKMKCIPASRIHFGSKPYDPSYESIQSTQVTRSLCAREEEKQNSVLLCCVAYGLVLSCI